jgi:uncharacterized protein (DUF2252 family)
MMTIFTPEERVHKGRSARVSVRRSSHAGWKPPAERADPVGVLEAQATLRVPELTPIRYGRMLASEFAFFRGAAAVMAADLASTQHSGLTVQLCGDAHVGNFGGFESPERSLVFDINDFDETLPGPWEWDVKRLAASLAVAGRDRGFSAGDRRRIVTETVRQYREAMAEFAGMGDLAVWYARLDATGITERWRTESRKAAGRGKLGRPAHTKDSMAAFAKLTHVVEGERRILSKPPLLVPVEELLQEEMFAGDVSAAQATLDASFRKYRSTLPRDRRHLLERFRYVHFARKVVGVGSVGTRAWILLLVGRDDADPLFLQFKEAQESVLAAHIGRSRYANQGQRVVEGQRLIQAGSDIFLGWVRATGIDGDERDFYARQLWDGKISPNIGRMSVPTLSLYGQMCGWTLARAHARSGDRIAIAGYLGSCGKFDDAIASFAEAYADQNAADYAALSAAAAAGRIEAQPGI